MLSTEAVDSLMTTSSDELFSRNGMLNGPVDADVVIVVLKDVEDMVMFAILLHAYRVH